MADDHYAAWYADRLWQLLPAIHRTLDKPVSPGTKGPLRELVDRIGAQAAVVRRSIDRLGENQSIETCDDWAIPYIGDLVGTRLVACLDAAAQRKDVAKTIYYRRRVGTVGLLEQLAADIATRDARVVEFFRRMARTRHQFDPPIGLVGDIDPAQLPPLAVAEGLVGRYSRTPAGGFADLRNVHGATSTGTAFDEFAHTADLRRGAQASGWYDISRLGVFVCWWLGYRARGAPPDSSGGATPCFTFDPTGRDIPLFSPSRRVDEAFGEHWVSPAEYQMPVAIRESLWKEEPGELYPDAPTASDPGAFSVGLVAGGTSAPLQRAQLAIHPERGRFSFVAGSVPGTLSTDYCFGFISTIGAGGFGDGVLDDLAQPTASVQVAAGGGLDAAIAAIVADTTLTVADSSTYAMPAASLSVPGAATVVMRAASGVRPVLRTTTAKSAWILQGNAQPHAAGASTVLVLQGLLVQGADLVLRGNFDTIRLRSMTLDPGTSAAVPAFYGSAIDGLALRPVTLYIEGTVTNLVLERCIMGPIRTRNGGAVQQLTATDCIIQAIATDPAGQPANPPAAWTDFALALSTGTVSLTRCTVIGPTATHRLAASECILDGLAAVEDPQHGCVRFSAIVDGSKVHAPYRCVTVPANAPLFHTRRFGRPDYAELRSDADGTLLRRAPGDSVLQGAQDGAEMGAFCAERIALLRRGLAIKVDEFMPVGQQPVWIDVD